jgi:hypothetical protein
VHSKIFIPYLTSHEHDSFQQKLTRSSEKDTIRPILVTGYSILIIVTEIIPPTALEKPW